MTRSGPRPRPAHLPWQPQDGAVYLPPILVGVSGEDALPPNRTFAATVLTPAELAAVQARIARGEVRVLDWARFHPPAYPGDPIVRNEHGRAVLSASGYSASPDYLDAGQWDDIHNNWVEALGYRNGGRYFHEGPPPPDLLVECECACGCRWLGRLDEASWSGDEGLVQCTACVAARHAPRVRWAGATGPSPLNA